MNKQQFFEMDVHLRAKRINGMLKGKSLSEVADAINIPPSTFSKEMQTGDYVYIKRENKYFHFIRDDKPSTKDRHEEQPDKAIVFLREHLDDLKALLQNYRGERVDLNPLVYSQSSKVITKTIRIRENVYKEFQTYCQENYPYYAIQDLIGHCLIEFTNKRNNH